MGSPGCRETKSWLWAAVSTSAGGLGLASCALGLGRPFVHLGLRALGCVNAKGLPGRRICLGKPCSFPGCFLSWWLGRDRGDKSRIKSQETGGREPSALSLLPHLSSCFSSRWRTGPSVCVCAGSRLTRAAGVTWPGHVQPAPFLPQQLAHKQPGCCGGGGADMCKRGGGARGPARAKGRRSLSKASPLPMLALPRHRKFLVLRCCCKTCFGK